MNIIIYGNGFAVTFLCPMHLFSHSLDCWTWTSEYYCQ